ncbi:N-acetylmannosamine-6-phosphate 2-epimerase [Mycoplasmopsis agassizii]|uniref:N-acetylmannosamine-6-phosphate 2-epimerase n=1 Tax=Mycoplasmopsis agassizii TaxID=33922 RepID=UPI0035273DDA
MKNKLNKPSFQFFVSCQALEDEPLFGKTTMLKMAKAAILGGADGIRTSQINNINLIKKNFPQVPLIGLIKREYDNSDVYISATLKELKALMRTDAEYLAVDATMRKRPKETLQELVTYFNNNNHKEQVLLADCSTIEDVKNALELGIKYIATTLRGATTETEQFSNTENDYQFIKDCEKLVHQNGAFLIAEGGLNHPKDLKAAKTIGCDFAVVGSAITRPRFITRQFIKESSI